MNRLGLAAYLQLALPFACAVLCAVWMIRVGQPAPVFGTLLPYLMLATAFAALVSVNLDRVVPRAALTGMNLAALLFFYLTTAHPAQLLALL